MKPNRIAKTSSPAKTINRKSRGMGKIGIPFRNEYRKGDEYQRERVATPHPINAPTTP